MQPPLSVCTESAGRSLIIEIRPGAVDMDKICNAAYVIFIMIYSISYYLMDKITKQEGEFLVQQIKYMTNHSASPE